MVLLDSTPTLIENIFGVIGQVITQFANVLSSSVTSITSIFFDSNNAPTLVGSLLLIAIGAGLCFWAFRLIKGLTKRA